MLSDHQYFLLRRLHSLFGIIPLGIFVIEHLITNASGIFGAAFYEDKVALIHMLGPFLPIVEALFIFIPLIFHVALGIYIALQAKHEGRLPYARNYAYMMQRWSGWVALIYIAWHTIHLRFMHDAQETPFSVVLAQMFSEGLYGIPGFAWILFYIVGGVAVIYHFANGICTFCMTWGITIGKRSQRYMAYFATATGVGLFFLLLVSIYAFWREAPKMQDPAYVQSLLDIHDNDH